jgi:hypothetical protein
MASSIQTAMLLFDISGKTGSATIYGVLGLQK